MMSGFVFFLTVLFSVFSADAQILPNDGKKTNSASVKSVLLPKKTVKNHVEEDGIRLNELTASTASASNDLSKTLSDAVVKTSVKSEKEEASEQNKEEDIFIPEGELYRLNTPTSDGSQRGGQAFVEVDEKGRMKKVEKIFLFYDNFKITNYMANTATCDVRFNILSNLDRKITQLDVKLVWPDITTTLSFGDILPNTQTYYNYSLIGNGCYGMDVAPNIIVNRCRVKGMTASECASKLVWLSK